MTIRNLFLILCIFVLPSVSFSQILPDLHLNGNNFKYDLQSDKLFKDTVKNVPGKNKVEKLNFGGLFIAPNMGVSFPLGVYGDFAISGFLYGVKFELAYSRLYPFVFGFVYEHQNNPASPEFINSRFLNSFNTKIVSLGGSLDIILNKFIRSNFTTPILSVEIKYATVSREYSPTVDLPDIALDDNLLTYSAGMGFTVYVFDLSGKFTFADKYSSMIFQMKFHFPVFNF